MQFSDVAGLVRGSGTRDGGLGGEYLGHLRATHALAHVVRCFDDEAVSHPDGRIDPVADAEAVDFELLLSDQVLVTRRRERTERAARVGEKSAQDELVVLDRLAAHLDEGLPARTLDVEVPEGLDLLTTKPVIYVANVSEAGEPERVAALTAYATEHGAEVVAVAARFEAELAELDDPDDRAAFLADLGLDEPGMPRLARACFRTLGLITFFTAGPMEARAWPVREGASAVEAAGKIHSDIARGFIRAEVIRWDDLVACGLAHRGAEARRAAGRGQGLRRRRRRRAEHPLQRLSAGQSASLTRASSALAACSATASGLGKRRPSGAPWCEATAPEQRLQRALVDAHAGTRALDAGQPEVDVAEQGAALARQDHRARDEGVHAAAVVQEGGRREQVGVEPRVQLRGLAAERGDGHRVLGQAARVGVVPVLRRRRGAEALAIAGLAEHGLAQRAQPVVVDLEHEEVDVAVEVVDVAPRAGHEFGRVAGLDALDVAHLELDPAGVLAHAAEHADRVADVEALLEHRHAVPHARADPSRCCRSARDRERGVRRGACDAPCATPRRSHRRARPPRARARACHRP